MVIYMVERKGTGLTKLYGIIGQIHGQTYRYRIYKKKWNG